MRVGGKEHEEELLRVRNSLITDGWRVIRLFGKSPDAIAAKIVDGKLKIVAVEILGKSYKKEKGWTRNWTYKQKRDTYSMFDDVFIKSYERNKHMLEEGGGRFPKELSKRSD